VPRFGLSRPLDPELVPAVRAVHLPNGAARGSCERGFTATPARATAATERVLGGLEMVEVCHEVTVGRYRFGYRFELNYRLFLTISGSLDENPGLP
jgi:hypothetical protein